MEYSSGLSYVSSWTKGILVFSFPDEASRVRVIEKGPWSLAGQLLALEPWRPNLRPGKDVFQKIKIWLRLSDLPLELWGKESAHFEDCC